MLQPSEKEGERESRKVYNCALVKVISENEWICCTDLNIL